MYLSKMSFTHPNQVDGCLYRAVLHSYVYIVIVHSNNILYSKLWVHNQLH